MRHWTGPKEHIELNGVKIRTLSIAPAKIAVDIKTAGTGIVTVQIMDGECELAQVSGEQRSFTIELSNAVSWSPEQPKLYSCRITFRQDEAEERFGIRTLSWGKNGLLINGKRVILRGACIHHDNCG